MKRVLAVVLVGLAVGATLAGQSSPAMVAKSKFAIGGAGNQYDFTVTAHTLVLTQKPAGAVIKLARLE
jgi:hypothetical protein